MRGGKGDGKVTRREKLEDIIYIVTEMVFCLVQTRMRTQYYIYIREDCFKSAEDRK